MPHADPVGARLRPRPGQDCRRPAEEARLGGTRALGCGLGFIRHQPDCSPGPIEARYLKTMLEGLPLWITWPVGVSEPAGASMRKATMVSLFWSAT